MLNFSDLKLKWKIITVFGLLLVSTLSVGLILIFNEVKGQVVYTALSGLMNFVDSKQQGVIRFLGQNEKLAKQLALLVENAPPAVVQKQFQAIVESDVFEIDDHQFKQEILDGKRHIPTWKVYHAIDFVRNGVIEISSDSERIGNPVQSLPNVTHGYSDVYLEGDTPIISFASRSAGGGVLVHANAGMLTVITNGEIGNLEGDMGAYYLAGVGNTFDYYIVNRDNVMVTESRVYPNALLQRKGSQFPWLMTMKGALELGMRCLPDGTYITNAGHYTGQREAMGFYAGQNGKEMIGVSMPFYDSNWTIVVEQEASELLSPLYDLTYRLLIWSFIALALVLTAGIFLASNISRPLSKIVKNVSQLRLGDTTVPVTFGGRKDEIGDLANAVEVFRENIIQKRVVDEKLRKLSHAVEQSAHMVMITDIDGVIEYVNPKFTEWMGYTQEEAIGQTPHLIQSGDAPDGFYAEMWQTILSGKEWHSEIKDRRKNGEVFWASIAIAPVRDETNRITHFIAIHEDITLRKEAELAMADAQRKAEIANKAKTDLLANMSHELRTPLNAIIGFTGAIKAEIFGPIENEQYLEYVDHIGSSGEHLLALINDILDVSAVEAGKLELHEEDVNVGELVEASIRLISDRALDKQIQLITDVQEDLPILHVDLRRLKQVLLNLLSNAVKFTPDGGEVTLSALLKDGGGLVFVISDTGIGMSNIELSKAMLQFGQVDSSLSRKEEGTGLGLPLTKSLVELHGGKFDILSEKDGGTTATVWFPPERVVDRKA